MAQQLTDDALIRLAFITHLPLHVSTWAQLIRTGTLSDDGRTILERWVALRLHAQPPCGTDQPITLPVPAELGVGA